LELFPHQKWLNAWKEGFLHQEVEIVFSDIFSALFCVLIPDFKVRHMVLTVMVHGLYVEERLP
jgi:hypothetical protein